MRGHRTLVRPYPISLEWPVRWVETAPSIEECRAQVWRELALKPNALLGIGVDRLDYTKGVEERCWPWNCCWNGIRSSAAASASRNWPRPAATKIERYSNSMKQWSNWPNASTCVSGAKDYKPILMLRSPS